MKYTRVKSQMFWVNILDKVNKNKNYYLITKSNIRIAIKISVKSKHILMTIINFKLQI